MELRFHRLLQSGGHDGLRNSVRDGRHPQNSDAVAIRFRDVDRQHRRREIAARGHPVPDLVEVAVTSFSKSSIEQPSTPGAPLLARTFR